MEIGGRRIPIADTMGVELVSREPGRAVLRFAHRPDLTNPVGHLQGGVYAVLLDMAMAVAAGGIATASMQFSVFRPTTGGVLTITGSVEREGRTLLYAEAEARDEQNRLVARGNQTGIARKDLPGANGESS